MVWNKSLPANNTKIRNLAAEIQPNWAAIETADLTFKPQAINLLQRGGAIPDDPPTIATACILFCKDDPVPLPELFARDPAGNIIQLTEGGKLGSSQTSIIAKNISYSGTNPFAVRWGRYQYQAIGVPPFAEFKKLDGSSEMDTPFAVLSAANPLIVTGTMSTAMANVNYGIVVSTFRGAAGTNTHAGQFEIINASSFKLRFATGQGGTVSPSDLFEFTVIIYGSV